MIRVYDNEFDAKCQAEDTGHTGYVKFMQPVLKCPWTCLDSNLHSLESSFEILQFAGVSFIFIEETARIFFFFFFIYYYYYYYCNALIEGVFNILKYQKKQQGQLIHDHIIGAYTALNLCGRFFKCSFILDEV